MKLKFSISFKKQLSEKLLDLGNLSLGALALGQFVSSQDFSPMVFLGGVTMFLTCYFVSYVVSS